MREYTAKDFKNARFAEHEDWGTAARTDDTRYPLWFVAKMGEPWFMEDHEMAESGWRPVVEARILEHTLRDLRHDLAVAQKERDRLAQNLRRLYGHPKGGGAIALDALEVAWESAEQADECRKGDVLILRDDYGAYEVYPAARDGKILTARILSRAPKREPWQDLAGVLADFAIHDHDGKEYPDVLARRLCERGVRVVGGEAFREAKAEAWDEGMEAGQRAIILKEYTPDNPYREDETDE